MKRTFIILLCLGAVHCGGRLQAQPPAPAGSTKIGVINMAQLYTKCDRIKSMKDRIEKQLEPYKKEKDDMEKLINDWSAVLKNNSSNLKPEDKERGVKTITECKRRLEDLQFRFNKDVAKRLEDEMSAPTKYIDEMVKHYSRERGFDLVVAFGEPEPPLAADLNFQRTVRAIDRGFMSPVFFPNAIDITQELITKINSVK